jgi:hypothetical protein
VSAELLGENFYFGCYDSLPFGFAQDLHITALGYLALDIWYSALSPKQILQVGLLHSVQIPPPNVLNFAPQT